MSSPQITQPGNTHAHLIQAATILGHQRVADTSVLVASVSTMAKAAYTAQFLPWSSHDLASLDVPLNRAFRRLLQLPPSHPNALLYMGTSDGGLGLPRLSDQVNLRKWSMLNRLQQRGAYQPLPSRPPHTCVGSLGRSILSAGAGGLHRSLLPPPGLG